jgi:hypothetical protein
VVLLSLAVTACTLGGRQNEARSTPAATTTATTEPQRSFVRTCEMSVYGILDAPAWKKHSITAGPLSFYYRPIARMADSEFDPVPGKSGYYRRQKLLVLVRRGAVATVVVPASARRYAALLYGPGDWNGRNQYRIKDGGKRRDIQGV